MNRRGFLRSAVAGLLGCALPTGLLAGPPAVLSQFVRLKATGEGPHMFSTRDGALYMVGVDFASPDDRDRTAAILMASRDGGQTWDVADPRPFVVLS